MSRFLKNRLQNFSLDLLSELDGVKNGAEFSRKLKKVINNIGFSDIDITRVDIAQKEGCSEVEFLISTLPHSLINTYCENSYFDNDVILEYLIHAKNPIFESKAYQYILDTPFYLPRFEESAKPHLLLKSYGYNDCYSIPVKIGLNGEKYVLSVLQENASEKEFQHNVKDKMDQLAELSKRSCDIISTTNFMPKPRKFNKNPLTLRQREILQVIANGANGFKDVAIILGISIRTVQDHVYKVKNILKTSNVAHTIYVAQREKFIN